MADLSAKERTPARNRSVPAVKTYPKMDTDRRSGSRNRIPQTVPGGVIHVVNTDKSVSIFDSPQLNKAKNLQGRSPDSQVESEPSPDRLADIKLQRSAATSLGFDDFGRPSSAPMQTQGRMPPKDRMYASSGSQQVQDNGTVVETNSGNWVRAPQPYAGAACPAESPMEVEGTAAASIERTATARPASRPAAAFRAFSAARGVLGPPWCSRHYA